MKKILTLATLGFVLMGNSFAVDLEICKTQTDYPIGVWHVKQSTDSNYTSYITMVEPTKGRWLISQENYGDISTTPFIPSNNVTIKSVKDSFSSVNSGPISADGCHVDFVGSDSRGNKLKGIMTWEKCM